MADYKSCSKCKSVKDISKFCKDKTQKDGFHPHCKTCRSVRHKQYYIKNKDKILAKNKKWSQNNKEYHRRINKENCRKRSKENPDFWKPYYEENKSEYTARTAKRRAQKKLATPTWADLEYIKFIYKTAKWLSMEVDHILPLQSDLVCGLHCEDNLQLLPMFENRSKGNKLMVGG